MWTHYFCGLYTKTEDFWFQAVFTNNSLRTGMLKDSFYTLVDLQIEPPKALVTIELNADHDIYRGHFPGQPVVPGACLLQIVKEITQLIAGSGLQIQKAEEIKFLQAIDPVKDNMLLGKMDYQAGPDNSLSISMAFSQGGTICFRCKAVLIRK
jgi:3-hydroxyacyl-[acyl-carrier-protein] dehydratase